MASDGFVEKGITYDSNGNIQTLSRTAAGSETENYRYTYAGNRMTQLHDSTTGASHSFAYDANGNMIRDGANNLDMTYNSSNLLKNVEQGGAILAKYSYLADGRKLTATESAGNELCYLGSLVYRTQNGTFDLESASFGGGRLVVSSEGLETRYFLTDHLGSVRQVVSGDGSVIEQNDYYPFGKRWAAVAAPISDNRHRFSGKEEQAFLSLPYVDFGARMYNPDWGRWFTQDPLAEKYYPIGQYCYCAGNPIRYIDSDGRKIRENSKHLKPHMQRILNKTPTGRIQYNKLVNNLSDVSIRREDKYYVDKQGVVNRNLLGEASLTTVLKDPETGEIIGGKIDIVLYLPAIKDDAEERKMRMDDREAATLAEEIEHTEAENIKLQLEEQKRIDEEKQKTGKDGVISYENKESEQEAHIFRDRVLRESGIEP